MNAKPKLPELTTQTMYLLIARRNFQMNIRIPLALHKKLLAEVERHNKDHQTELSLNDYLILRLLG